MKSKVFWKHNGSASYSWHKATSRCFHIYQIYCCLHTFNSYYIIIVIFWKLLLDKNLLPHIGKWRQNINFREKYIEPISIWIDPEISSKYICKSYARFCMPVMSVYYKTSQRRLMYFAGAKNRHVMLVFVTFLSSLGLHTTCSEQIKHREKSLHGLYSDLSSWIPMNILVYCVSRLFISSSFVIIWHWKTNDRQYDLVCGSICQTVESDLILWEFKSDNLISQKFLLLL